MSVKQAPTARTIPIFLLLALAGCAPELRETPNGERAHVSLPAFTIFDPAPGFHPPSIVLQYDSAKQTGTDWALVGDATRRGSGSAAAIGDAAEYLRFAWAK